MKAKRKTNNKLLVSICLVIAVSLAAVAAVVTVLAATNHTVNSAISLNFIAEDIEGRVTAEYKISTEADWTTIGEWDFMAKDDQQTKVMSPDAFQLNAGDTIEFRYTFRNYGDVDYTGILALDKPTADSNVVVQYKYNSNAYTDNHYGLVVEGLSGAPTAKIKTDTATGKHYTEMTYYIQFGADNKGKNGEYNSNFVWDLKEYVAAPGEETIKLAATTFVEISGTNTYSAQYNGEDISVSGAAASGVSAQDTSIQNVWYVPSKFGSASVASVKKGEDLPANTKVVLGDGVTTIEYGTFSMGYDAASLGLIEIVIGNGITEILEGTFECCTNLRSVTFGPNVTTIRSYAFSMTGLVSVVIPNNIISIGGAAFAGCASLKEITIPSSVTSIGDHAFASCPSVEVLNYNANITIADYIFASLGQNAIKTVVNINSTTVPTYLFYECSYIDEVNFGNNVTRIGWYSFEKCTGLTSIIISNSVKTIGSSAFSGCIGLKEIIIPGGVTYIDVGAFDSCTGLTTITIPSSVTNIECLAFFGCENLTSAIFEDPNGWTYAGPGGSGSLSATDLQNPATAALYLNSTYREGALYHK